MRTINANNGCVTPSLVLGALRGLESPAVSARAHSAQCLAWKKCAIAANAAYFNPKQFPDAKMRVTMAGVPIEEDDSLPVSTLEFLDANNNIVVRIETLAVPCEYVLNHV